MNDNSSMYEAPNFEQIVEAEVQRRILESDEAAKLLATELETHIKLRSSGFYWFRVEESEKRLIELRRRRHLVDAIQDEQFVNCSTASLLMEQVDDIPEAVSGSWNHIHEKEVGEKLHQLETLQLEREELMEKLRNEGAEKAELVAELEKQCMVQTIGERLVAELEYSLAQSLQREVEIQANMVGLREALETNIQREASLRADLEQNDVQLQSNQEQDEKHKLQSGLRGALEDSLRREHELSADLDTHREALRAALQRETALQTELHQKNMLLRDAAKWRAAAELREAALQKLLKEAQETSRQAATRHNAEALASPGSLLKYRLPSSTMLVDVVFPTQNILGFVIVPHELFYNHGAAIAVTSATSPTKGALAALRPLGDEPVIDCCMISSSVVAHCIIPGDILLSINGTALVCNRIDELHTENYPEIHFNKVMDIVANAGRPRRLRFLRLAHRGNDKSPANMKDARQIVGAHRFLNEKEVSILFDERAAVQHTDSYEYTITTGSESATTSVGTELTDDPSAKSSL